MHKPIGQPLGVIEGFYGHPWSASDRADVVRAVSSMGYSDYIYAPKSDRKLRKEWRSRWGETELEEIRQLSTLASRLGLAFGMGLSPLGLSGLSNNSEREALAAKIEQLNTLKLDRLCILFDDMPTQGEAMVSGQLSICDYITTHSNATSFIICPSYYSTDVVLERVFGERPENYWLALGRGLDSRIDFFWTGEKVCSTSYNKQNLDYIASQLQRKPVLWDNYPVNDGERLSRYLNILPFEGREVWLAEYIKMHFSNPMNQAHLSLIPLSTLPAVYFSDCSGQSKKLQESLWHEFIQYNCVDISAALLEDAAVFQRQGLDGMDTSEKEKKLEKYVSSHSPYAKEIAAWLRDEYKFDPDCLTD